MNNEAGGQGALESLQSFFDVKSATSGVDSALGAVSWIFTMVIWAVQIIGLVALGVWIFRIGVDIVLITMRGTTFADNLSKFGTSTKGAESYKSVAAYLKGNLLEIVLVVVLVSLLITGWIFRIFSMALSGFGSLLNKLLGLDVDGLISSADAQAWQDNIKVARNASIRNEYDAAVSDARGYLSELYAMQGVSQSDPTYKATSRKYSVAIAKCQYIASSKGADVTKGLNLDSGYFTQHKYNDSVCNAGMLSQDVMAAWGGSNSCN